MRAKVSPLLEGGWIALPALAVLGGVWAFARPVINETPTTLAAALALVIGGWQPLWCALTQTDWATPLQQWRGWTDNDPLPAWPYLQEGTPGAALHQRLRQARSWWRQVGRMSLAQPLTQSSLGLLVSLLLGAALGRSALLLTAFLLTWAELAALWHEGEGQVGMLWQGIAVAGLPWLLGGGLMEGNRMALTLSALSISLLVSLYGLRSWWSLLGPGLGATFLVAQGKAFAAGLLLLFALPGLIALSYRPSREAHRRLTGPWVLAMVALTALAL
ncbi:MAG: hypothetical protein ACP5HG_14335 [Anaerolineae bacterium]